MRNGSCSNQALSVRYFFQWTLFILLTTALATAPLAQQFQGTITGTIKASTGAVVKGASVTATNIATKTPFNTVT